MAQGHTTSQWERQEHIIQEFSNYYTQNTPSQLILNLDSHWTFSNTNPSLRESECKKGHAYVNIHIFKGCYFIHCEGLPTTLEVIAGLIHNPCCWTSLLESGFKREKINEAEAGISTPICSHFSTFAGNHHSRPVQTKKRGWGGGGRSDMWIANNEAIPSIRLDSWGSQCGWLQVNIC